MYFSPYHIPQPRQGTRSTGSDSAKVRRDGRKGLDVLFSVAVDCQTLESMENEEGVKETQRRGIHNLSSYEK